MGRLPGSTSPGWACHVALAGRPLDRRLPGGVGALAGGDEVADLVWRLHLVAAAVGYQGCPELGADSEVWMLGGASIPGVSPARRLDG